jgi:site-specific recombinase XerD
MYFRTMKASWESLIRDFASWMKYRNLSNSTQRVYSGAAVSLANFLDSDRDSPDFNEVSRRHVEAFVRHRLAEVKPATVSAEFRALQQFVRWLVREEEIDTNPMTGAQAPIVPEEPVQVLEVDQLRAMIDSCKGNDLVSHRDNAIIRLLIDTGASLSEISDLAVTDVDFDAGVCYAIGKGRRARALPFGQATALALGCFLTDAYGRRPSRCATGASRVPIPSADYCSSVHPRGLASLTSPTEAAPASARRGHNLDAMFAPRTVRWAGTARARLPAASVSCSARTTLPSEKRRSISAALTSSRRLRPG